MNLKINKSKSIYNFTISKKNGKSLYNFIKTESNVNNLEKEKKERAAKIKKIREVDPTYLLEEELN